MRSPVYSVGGAAFTVGGAGFRVGGAAFTVGGAQFSYFQVFIFSKCELMILAKKKNGT